MTHPRWVGYIGVLGLLGGTLITGYIGPGPRPEGLRTPLSHVSSEIAGWTMAGAEEELDARQFSASAYLARTYVKDDYLLALLIAFHDHHQTAVNIHNPKNCLPGDGWEIWKTDYATVSFDGRPVIVHQHHIFKMGGRMAVLYWYQSRQRVIASEYQAKLMLLRDALVDRRTSGSFVRIVLRDEPEVLSEGIRFAGVVMHQVQLCFRP